MRTYFRRADGRTVQPSGPKQFGRTVWFGVPDWVDPYWWIQGSEPEKMLMDALVRLGIYFEHTPQTNPIKWGILKELAPSDPTQWEPDFLLPQYKIWIEVQGTYFHTLPGAMERDALRRALIIQAGWQPYFWSDYEIQANLWNLLNTVPEFRTINAAANRGRRRNVEGRFWEGLLAKDSVDHLAGLRTQNRSRAKPPQELQMRWRRSYTRQPK